VVDLDPYFTIARVSSIPLLQGRFLCFCCYNCSVFIPEICNFVLYQRLVAKMDKLERMMSRPVAKPYRSSGIKDNAPPYLNSEGLLDFSPDDIESKCYLLRLIHY
jgi:hypothetical protein